MVTEVDASSRCRHGIRLKTAAGNWKVVKPSEDGRVTGVLERMKLIVKEVGRAVRADGWVFRRAGLVCEVQGGEQHSIDLVLVKAGRVLFLETKWSGTAIADAHRAGEATLDRWLRAAAKQCTLVYPSGARRAHVNGAAGVLAASPYGWSMEIDGRVYGHRQGRFSEECAAEFGASRGRLGTSGSAKRSRNPSLKAHEKKYRQIDGREGHNASTRASMSNSRCSR